MAEARQIEWRFEDLAAMAGFMREQANKISDSAKKQPSHEADLLRREAYAWREAARLVDNSVFNSWAAGE